MPWEMALWMHPEIVLVAEQLIVAALIAGGYAIARWRQGRAVEAGWLGQNDHVGPAVEPAEDVGQPEAPGRNGLGSRR